MRWTATPPRCRRAAGRSWWRRRAAPPWARSAPGWGSTRWRPAGPCASSWTPGWPGWAGPSGPRPRRRPRLRPRPVMTGTMTPGSPCCAGSPARRGRGSTTAAAASWGATVSTRRVGDEPPAPGVEPRLSAGPDWADDEALDQAFAGWTPGPSPEAHPLERELVLATGPGTPEPATLSEHRLLERLLGTLR